MSSSFDFYWFNLAFHPQMTKMLNQMTKNSEKISNNKKKKGKTTQNHNILHQVSDFTEKNSLFDEKSSLQTTSSQISQFTFEQKTTNFTKEQTFNENQTMNKNQTFNHQTFNKNQTMNQNQTFNHQTMNQNQTFNHQTMNKNQTFNHQTMNQNQTFNHQTMNKNQTFNHQTMNQNQTFNHQTMNQNQTFNHQTMNQNHITNQTIQKTNNPGDKTPIKLIINENRQLQIKSNKSVAQVLSKCSSANTLLQNRKSPGLPFKYDPGANHWTISLAHFTNAITLLKKHFTFDQIPNDTIKILEKNAKSEQKVVDQGIFDKNKKSDDNLSNDKNQINTSTDMILLHRISSFLLPHQREAVDIAIKKSGRLILADEMGLGKTITALAIAAYYKNDWPCLIICPSGLMENWRNEIDRFLNFEL
ncbi:Snf2/Rad54-like helicase, partial [Pseudoloma neurophilia]